MTLTKNDFLNAIKETKLNQNYVIKILNSEKEIIQAFEDAEKWKEVQSKSRNLDKQNLFFDLINPQYWDVYLVGNKFGRLQTRMEYDIETCHDIRDIIIHLLKTGGQYKKYIKLVELIKKELIDLQNAHDQASHYPLETNNRVQEIRLAIVKKLQSILKKTGEAHQQYTWGF